MSVIGSDIRIGSAGPGGVREIGYSNFFVVGQTPWGIPNTYQISTSFGQWIRQYGGLSKLTTVAAGTTAETYSTETTNAVVQAYYAVKAYFEEKGPNGPGALYFCRVVATTAGPTAALKTFADLTTNNTTITSKWPGRDGGATLVTITNPSPTGGADYAQVIAEHVQSGIREIWELGSSLDAANISKKSELISIALPAGGQLPVTAARSKLNNGLGSTPATPDPYTATAPDHVGTVTTAGVKTGLQVFADQALGTGFVAIPGLYTAPARTGIAIYAAAYYRLGLLGAPSSLTLTTVVADLATNGRDLAYW